MRQYLAKLGLAFLVGGCSLLYNPSNIIKPPPDSPEKMDAPPPDAEMIADANPKDVMIVDVFPATIAEGAGTGNSRPALFVLHGHNFIKGDPSLAVAITPTAAATVTGFEVSSDGDYIAVTAMVPVDTACSSGTKPLVATVTEGDGMGGTVMALSPNMTLSVQCLPELMSAPTSSAGLAPLYSTISISGAVAFPPALTSPSVILRSVSSITIGNITASASGRNAGPGGGAGGDDKTVGAGPSPGQGNTNGGGGGGFVIAGATGGTNSNGGAGGGFLGDAFISSYLRNASSGGGGGGVGTLGAAHSSVGGGGGGTVELTAGGDVTAGTISANGGAGAMSTAVLGTAGGGGTGGVILVRAGATLNAGALSVAKGAPGGATGGASSDGRIRADAAHGTKPAGATAGPMFVDAPSLVTSYPSLNFSGADANHDATLYVYDKSENIVANMSYTPQFGPTGSATVPNVVLKIGYNKICVTVANGTSDPTGSVAPEANNCVEIGYTP